MTHRPPPADAGIASPIQAYLDSIHARHATLADGEVATYIPELGKANPDWFGIAIATTDGRVYETGDTRQTFTIQSISKAITYGLALEDQGHPTVLGKIGVEPTGDAFNSISLQPGTGRPLNPMINAGAIATTSLVAGRSHEDKLERLLAVFGLYAGRTLEIDDAVYRSETETGHRNRAIGHMLRTFDILTEDPDGALDLYFRQCSILVDCRDLAAMAATLANGGVNPATGQRAIRHELVESVLSVMTTCGMYDFAGEWVYAVGMPAKSGVGGGIMAVLPGQVGIGVFSPKLDARGNSVRGVAACKDMSRDLNLHFLRVPRASRTTIRGEYDLGQMRSRRLRTAGERAVLEAERGRVRTLTLQGDLGFAAIETVVRHVVDASATTDIAIVDLQRVTYVEACAVAAFADLTVDLTTAGKQLVLVGAQHHPSFARALEERLTAIDQWGSLRRFADLDAALEWSENRLLADAPGAARDAVTLGEHDLCAGLGPADLATLATLLRPMRFAHGALIVREGEPADDIFLLVRGLVSVTIDLQGRRQRLSTVSPGMVFGELTFIDRSPRTADVRADTVVECFALSAKDLDHLGATQPALKVAILTNLLKNVQQTVTRLGQQVTALGA